MPRLALLLYALFFALAFGWRTWLQLRSTGSSGFAGISRGGALERLGGVLFVVALALGVAAPVANLGAAAGGSPLFAAPAALALAVYGAGLALTLAAQLAMGASWRIGVDPSERTQLVTRGPFRFARNPIFTGMIAVALSLALLVPNAWSLLALLALVSAVQLQVRRVEEPFLLRSQGEPYRIWAARTGRFLPGLGRLR
jgi:protein-S-isoprenylcysteine O-methyltransferase Ste14